MKKILQIMLNTLLVLLIVIGAGVAFSLLPIKKNIKILAVLSGSMEPTIPTGGLIVIVPVSTYNEQDIISFNPKDAKTKKDIVTHRIVEQKEINSKNAFITKGDANNAPDADPVYKDQIIGKHLFSVALVGYALGYIKTLPGLLIIILVPSTIIIYEEVKKIKDEAKSIIQRRKDKREAGSKKKRKNDKNKS